MRKEIVKRLFILLLLPVVAVMSACTQGEGVKGNSDEVKALFEKKDNVVIDCFGDSITWGMYSSPELRERWKNNEIEASLDDGGQFSEKHGLYVSGVNQSDPTYPEALEEKLNEELEGAGLTKRVEVYNDGICGDWISPDSYTRISCSPDIVIMLYCGNNYYYGVEADGVMEENIKALRQKGCIVYLADYIIFEGSGLPAIFEKANEHIKKVAKSTKTPLIDLDKLVKKSGRDIKELFSPDHIHLSPEGYRLTGRLIAEAIFEDIR